MANAEWDAFTKASDEIRDRAAAPPTATEVETLRGLIVRICEAYEEGEDEEVASAIDEAGRQAGRAAVTKDAHRYPTQAECTEIADILKKQRAEGAGWDGNGSPVETTPTDMRAWTCDCGQCNSGWAKRCGRCERTPDWLSNETPAPPCIFRSGCVNGQPCKDAGHCTEGAEWKRRLGVSEEGSRT
jgi:hypothetical protein